MTFKKNVTEVWHLFHLPSLSQNSDSAHMLKKKDIFNASTLILMCYVNEDNVAISVLALSIWVPCTVFAFTVFNIHGQTSTTLLCQ